MTNKEDELEHYFMCNDCAVKKGGIYPEGHVCTMTFGECPYCKRTRTLIPWCDFNWPKDRDRNQEAIYGRD